MWQTCPSACHNRSCHSFLACACYPSGFGGIPRSLSFPLRSRHILQNVTPSQHQHPQTILYKLWSWIRHPRPADAATIPASVRATFVYGGRTPQGLTAAPRFNGLLKRNNMRRERFNGKDKSAVLHFMGSARDEVLRGHERRPAIDRQSVDTQDKRILLPALPAFIAPAFPFTTSSSRIA